MTKHTIGVDISKSHLDVFRLEDQAAQRFENSAAGFRALAKWLGKNPSKNPSKNPVARVVFEPTGAYHKAFEAALGGVFPLVKINPWQARRFAEACGVRAKTDAVDAQMLARMGAALKPEPQAPQSENAIILKDLHVARAGLIKERTRLRNRAHTQNIPLLKHQTKTRLTLVERQIADLDAEIAAQVAARTSTARTCEILRSMPGVGAVSAAAIQALMPEIGTLDRKQVASLAGLAPITRQSGQWKGRSSIGSGRKPLRDALYMPALVAMRCNPDLQEKYTRLRAAGKPAKVAIVAIMRNLIEMANALVKADRIWVQKSA